MTNASDFATASGRFFSAAKADRRDTDESSSSREERQDSQREQKSVSLSES